MKIFVAIAYIAIFALSYADEEKKARLFKFYKCFSCSNDTELIEEYIKCEKLRSEASRSIAEECKVKLLPSAKTLRERLAVYCKNDQAENEKIYDCIMNDERRDKFTDDEKAQQEEFGKCLRTIDKNFCKDQ